MIVRDKGGDIAILRTLGASPKTVTKIFLWQGCLIGLIGTVCGLLFGLLGAIYVTNLPAGWSHFQPAALKRRGLSYRLLAF